MNLNQVMRVSSSGMIAERSRMDIASGNIANANSMRTPTQDAYRRQIVVLQGGDNGVKVRSVIDDETPLRADSDPHHPFADEKGLVYYSNVDPVFEMVNLMSANRAYEANIAAFNAAKGMVKAALQIGKI